jgi:hypothetical protein
MTNRGTTKNCRDYLTVGRVGSKNWPEQRHSHHTSTWWSSGFQLWIDTHMWPESCRWTWHIAGPSVDGTFRHIDKPRSACAGQSHRQIVGFHPIITSSGLNERVIDLDELFGVVGVVILVNQSRFELVGLGDLPEHGCQSTERAPPWWCGGSC